MNAAKIRKFLACGKLPLLLAALLVVLAFSLEFHHHDDGKPHRDCSLCAAFHHARSADLHAQQTGVPVLERALLSIPSETVASSFHHRFPLVIRPPPA